VAAERRQRDKGAAPKTPILKSQRTPRDFRNPTIKTDRRLSRDPSYVAEFVNTPIRLEDVAIELSDEEAAMLDGLRLPVYGADDGGVGVRRNSPRIPTLSSASRRYRAGTGSKTIGNTGQVGLSLEASGDSVRHLEFPEVFLSDSTTIAERYS
jgi:hypothetical protein